jgi:uracil-DNA glycosylase
LKQKELSLLYEELGAASLGAFFKTRDDMVYGEGNFDALVMLVGEAPGAEETRQKKPFVGKAGENLNEFLQVLELCRAEIFITNVVKFRPFVEGKNGRRRNRPPTTREQNHQTDFLKREIKLICPKLVVTLGNTALRAVYGDKKTVVGEVHGRAIRPESGFLLFPLYHPASIIYNPALKEVYHADLLALKQLLCTNHF